MRGGSGRARRHCCCPVVDLLQWRSPQWRMLQSFTDSQPEGCSCTNTLEALTFQPQRPAAALPSMSRSRRRSSQPFNDAPSLCTSRRNPARRWWTRRALACRWRGRRRPRRWTLGRSRSASSMDEANRCWIELSSPIHRSLLSVCVAPSVQGSESSL